MLPRPRRPRPKPPSRTRRQPPSPTARPLSRDDPSTIERKATGGGRGVRPGSKLQGEGSPIMANAAVDQLKNVALRHGEKALVGLTAALFLVFSALAVIKPTVEIKPEQLKSTAEQADANLGKQQDPKDILARLEESGLKNPEFEKMVENQQAHPLNPADYRVKQDWVTP